jgi:hypothetical protein
MDCIASSLCCGFAARKSPSTTQALDYLRIHGSKLAAWGRPEGFDEFLTKLGMGIV